MHILSIDPGKHANAYAYFFEGELQSVLKEEHKNLHAKLSPADSTLDVVVIEKPQAYAGHTAKNNAIIDVAIGAGFALGVFFTKCYNYQLVLPREWKGQVPKAIHQKRIMAKLSQEELALLEGFNKGELKDIIDAIGIGLWWLEQEGLRA